nr:MAG TPA: hypothetical protein [Caudoviricetes sp.]
MLYINLFSLYFNLCSYRKCWKSAKHRTLVLVSSVALFDCAVKWYR